MSAILINIDGSNNKTNLLVGSKNSKIMNSLENTIINNTDNTDNSDNTLNTDNSDNTLNIEGYDLDGYLINASGEVYNFKNMYDLNSNEFETSNTNTIYSFNTDPSYGRFEINLPLNIPSVLFFELTGGFDIFRLDENGNPKENKNTFSRVLINSNDNTDTSNVTVSPVTTMISEIFINLCLKDLSNNILLNDLSFTHNLNRASNKVLKILGPDFSGANINLLNKDPYDEIEYAIDTSDNDRLEKSKKLLKANMKIFSILNNICDDFDASVNSFDKNKEKKYRRKCFRKFARRREKDFNENNKDLDKSLEEDNDIRKIEREAAEELGIDYSDISNNRKTNDKFIKEMPRKFNEEKNKLDLSGVDHEKYIESFNDMDEIFEEMKKEEKNGRKKSKPRESEQDFDIDFEDKKREYSDGRNNNPSGFKPLPPSRFKPRRKR